MYSTVKPFIEKSNEVNDTLIDVLNDRLGLPKGALAKRHDVRENSGSEGRAIKNPPNQAYTADKAVLGSHTDFGSLVRTSKYERWASYDLHRTRTRQSFLHHHQLGGLQVLPPGSKQWKYVKVSRCSPIPTRESTLKDVPTSPSPDTLSATLVILSPSSAVASCARTYTALCTSFRPSSFLTPSCHVINDNEHRPPPKDQAAFERWSVVFFTRPGEGQLLTPLASESTMIAEAAAGRPELTTDSTAGEWYVRRITNQRLKNRKGPETWALSRGTEYDPENAEVY